MPRFLSTAAVFALLSFFPSCAGQWRKKDVKVEVYEGPKPSECKNSDESRPTKVLPDHTVEFHFTITIDKSSKEGRAGTKVTSSRNEKGGNPASLPIGQGKVIKGLDKGLVGLCKGSKAYIVIPPELAYGENGAPKIPGGATIRYDVEVLDILPPLPNDFSKIDTNADWKLSKEEVSAYFEKIDQQIDVEGLWKKEDANGDGVISWEEFSGSKGRDGPPKPRGEIPNDKIPKAEMTEEQQKAEEEIKSHIKVFYHMDENNDGKISKAELEKSLNSFGQELEESLWKHSDQDEDGFISVDEFAMMGRERDEL